MTEGTLGSRKKQIPHRTAVEPAPSAAEWAEAERKARSDKTKCIFLERSALAARTVSADRNGRFAVPFRHDWNRGPQQTPELQSAGVKVMPSAPGYVLSLPGSSSTPITSIGLADALLCRGPVPAVARTKSLRK